MYPWARNPQRTDTAEIASRLLHKGGEEKQCAVTRAILEILDQTEKGGKQVKLELR
jgi:hypothetical protein